MAIIKISELRPAGSELFQDSESFLNELTDQEMGTFGGRYNFAGNTAFNTNGNTAFNSVVSYGNTGVRTNVTNGNSRRNTNKAGC